ncbi:P-loop containing nucleoside triphosphate hydrolase protein [Dichotomocladium elegans]|nr:P-loop containing nucleoside triphosphate hydrolase protein [Dichotomocladium elegans]
MAAEAPSPQVQQALEVYTKGTRVWFEDADEAWVSASAVSKEITPQGVKIIFVNDEDDTREHVYESSFRLLNKSQGADLPPLRNPPKMENTDDLTSLSYLNEPSVLNTIKTRYLQRSIYTYSGIVLIATNPFARVQLYEPDIIQQYSGRRRGELEPHLFAIAEDAYRCMIREQSNQTIVVSGESGAGKTVSAKYIMRYFATADDKEALDKTSKGVGGGAGMTEVEEQILATNPIMEAFGNAKTTRNDNSSRFGKYIEIQFDKKNDIVGAKIRTYLLERSRLIFQPETERNYHIFYQLCAGIPLTERKEFELKDWTKYHYLNQSGTGMIPGVNDAEEFEITKNSLSMVGINLQTQWQIFRLLAALLHIGNIAIAGRNDATLADSDPALIMATKLLGIKTSDFRKWIVKKQIVTRNDKIISNLNPAQATVVRDSVAKYIYANLFEWLVSVVNDSLSCHEPGHATAFIGVLDIYGFEHFKKNSFEQFCINYANEKLQQQFNQHVFKLEQEEYVREKIAWQFIEFSDNQKCIEMIEARMGILSLLDEESRLPSGTDQGFCDKLIANFATPAYKGYFKKPRFSNNAFTVVHYAHEVQYEAEGFIDKNKDTVPDEHLALLQNADSSFLVEMLQTAASAAAAASAQAPAAAAPAKPGPRRMNAAPKKPTLGSIFKLSLISLMDTIGQTNVHYIRCIKPNEAKVAWEFDANMVLSQLRACGVLETIRISCAGYPSRWTFEDFAERYFVLVSSTYWDRKKTPDIRRLCTAILDTSIHDKDKYQIGLSKIFFRAGQLAFLEKRRADRFNECAVLIQKNMRRYLARQHYLQTKIITLRLQRVARMKMGMRKLELLRQERAAVVIQKYMRGHLGRKRVDARRNFVTRVQAAIRGRLARQAFGSFRINNAAIQIQRLLRGWSARQKFIRKRKHIIGIQACIRRRQARRQLGQLRQEARSIKKTIETSYKLENKVVELTHDITRERDQKKAYQSQVTQMESQLQQWIDKFDALERRSREDYKLLQGQFEALQHSHESLQQDYNELLARSEGQEKEINRLQSELTRVKQQPLKVSTTALHIQENDGDVTELKSQIAALKAQLKNNASKRQPSMQGIGRTLSPARRSPSWRGYSPDNYYYDRGSSPRARSPAYNSRRSSIKSRRESAVAVGNGGGRKPFRPISIDYSHTLRELNVGHRPAEEAMHAILQDEQVLEDEVLEGLIRSLKIPLPSAQDMLSRKHIVFPAHMIGIGLTQMWRFGYLPESERLVFTVMDTIQKHCLNYLSDDAIGPCAFWLTNTHELLSLVCSAEQDLEREMQYNSVHRRRSIGWHEFEKLMSTIKFELQCLEDNLYHHWLTEMKQKLSKMAVPALIESQSLPGFVSNESNRFLNRLLPIAHQPPFSMDDLLNFLNKVFTATRCYMVDPNVAEQGLTELLKLIGITTFNDVVMRRNFNSWKRAMQIQYNITRLEEWCKGHDLSESVSHLEHLKQAVKLLQLKKTSDEDLDIIYDACWVLTPTQIQKLVQNYLVADYEEPVSNDILRAVAARVSNNDSSDILLLDNVSLDDSPYEVPEPHSVVPNTFLPADVSRRCECISTFPIDPLTKIRTLFPSPPPHSIRLGLLLPAARATCLYMDSIRPCMYVCVCVYGYVLFSCLSPPFFLFV